MLINVIKYVAKCGTKDLCLPTYEIIPEDESLYEQRLKELQQVGVEEIEDLSVEIKPCHLDYKTGFVNFPQFGIKRHITGVIRNSTLGKIIHSVTINISDYLSK
jgi:hypothetical protein